MYEYTDKILDYLNKRFIRSFKKLKSILKFDEINKIKKDVDDCYKECFKETRLRYLDIARRYYKKASEKDKEDVIDLMWIDNFLSSYDPITKYVFVNEVDRKRARTFEAIVATQSTKDVDTSIRLWAGQVKQWADEVTDEATIQGFKDRGVKYVKWNTEKDDRRCKICYDREGKIYPIDKVPEKPHIGCRCWLTVAKEDSDGK